MTVETDKNTRVFVYGSLKAGFSNHGVLKGADHVADTFVSGAYRMVSLGGFPGVIADPDYDRVITGEIYAVDETGLAALDMLEGNGSFYTRVKARADNGMRCWIYLLPIEEYSNELDVPGGNWEELSHNDIAF